MDGLAPRLGTEVICQIGHGTYTPRKCLHFRFETSLSDYLEGADLVISHGGQGSLLEAIRYRKRLVGVSNPDRRDGHQDEILSKFSELNHLIWCRSLADLESAIRSAFRARFDEYQEPWCAMQTAIYQFLVENRRPALSFGGHQ
jgi:UDP-N-acetylglucosamine transferase subunit ALG13